MGARTPSRLAARQFVEVGLELARGKFSAGFDLFAALPPVGALIVKNALGTGVSLAEFRRFLLVSRG